ncbi:unnamed protein product [Closterium sp. NIES-54]
MQHQPPPPTSSPLMVPPPPHLPSPSSAAQGVPLQGVFLHMVLHCMQLGGAFALGSGLRRVRLGGYGCTDPLLNKPFYLNGLVVGIMTISGLNRFKKSQPR